MPESRSNVWYIAPIVIMAMALAALVVTNPTQEDRVARLGAVIMCPVCQGESIGSSPAPMARDMMDLIDERVAAGASDAEIIDELLTAYTGALLLDPPVSGPTIVLWVAPAVALLAGIGVIIWWRRQPPPAGESAPAEPRSRSRQAIGALILIGSFAAIVMVIGFFLQERDDFGGLAGMPIEGLDSVSNQTMEAVIATNADHPDIDGMRLALADRYFQEGDYRAAFPHFMEVANSPTAVDREVEASLVGLAWITWDGNREPEIAIELFDQALAINSESVNARYLKSMVLWCGADSPEDASNLLRSILDQNGVGDDTRAQIESDLSALDRGEECL